MTSLCDELRKDIINIKIVLALLLEHTRQPMWFNSYEVQNYLNISKLTLKRYREMNKIRCITFRGRYRYLNKDVQTIKFTIAK